jgi:hypothetical protein
MSAAAVISRIEKDAFVEILEMELSASDNTLICSSQSYSLRDPRSRTAFGYDYFSVWMRELHHRRRRNKQRKVQVGAEHLRSAPNILHVFQDLWTEPYAIEIALICSLSDAVSCRRREEGPCLGAQILRSSFLEIMSTNETLEGTALSSGWS